jgi:hypothetical protein
MNFGKTNYSLYICKDNNYNSISEHHDTICHHGSIHTQRNDKVARLEKHFKQSSYYMRTLRRNLYA